MTAGRIVAVRLGGLAELVGSEEVGSSVNSEVFVVEEENVDPS